MEMELKPSTIMRLSLFAIGAMILIAVQACRPTGSGIAQSELLQSRSVTLRDVIVAERNEFRGPLLVLTFDALLSNHEDLVLTRSDASKKVRTRMSRMDLRKIIVVS